MAANYAYAPGRYFVALLFIITALMFFRSADFAFAESVIAAHKLLFPSLLLVATIVMQLSCGTMIAIGWNVKWPSAILLVWLVPATWMFHPFWAATGPDVPNPTFQFLKNVAIAGALLLLIGTAANGSKRRSTTPA